MWIFFDMTPVLQDTLVRQQELKKASKISSYYENSVTSWTCPGNPQWYLGHTLSVTAVGIGLMGHIICVIFNFIGDSA